MPKHGQVLHPALVVQVVSPVNTSLMARGYSSVKSDIAFDFKGIWISQLLSVIALICCISEFAMVCVCGKNDVLANPVTGLLI